MTDQDIKRIEEAAKRSEERTRSHGESDVVVIQAFICGAHYEHKYSSQQNADLKKELEEFKTLVNIPTRIPNTPEIPDSSFEIDHIHESNTGTLKVYPVGDKPDFFDLAEAYFKKENIGPGWLPTTKVAVKYGMEKIWNDYYLPLKEHIDLGKSIQQKHIFEQDQIIYDQSKEIEALKQRIKELEEKQRF